MSLIRSLYLIICASRIAKVAVVSASAQIIRYNDLINDIDSLAIFSTFHKNIDLMGRIVENGEGIAVFNFGKNKGRSVEDVLLNEPGYYGWMMNGDFPLYTKKVLSDIKQSIK